MNPKELEIFKKFIKFAKGELGIISLPKFKFTAQPLDGTQGTYDIGKSITIFTKNRHIADVCRTSVHELTHHRQFEKGELKPNEEAQDIGGKIENEANAIAGILIKKFAKMICPEIYEPEGLTEDCKLKHSDITAKDLAIKHSQFIGTMEKEIELGISIEKEHSDDEKVARSVALAHIYEFPDYYSNKKYGLKAMEKKLEKANESKIKRLEAIIRENTGLSIIDEAPLELTYKIMSNDGEAGEINIATSHKDLGPDCLEIIGFKLDPRYKTIKTALEAVHSLFVAYKDANKIVVSPADESVEFWSKLGFNKLNNDYYFLARAH